MHPEKAPNPASVDDLEKKLFSRSFAALTTRVAHSRRLSRALELIASRYRDSLTLESAAHRCGVEKNHLNTLLQRSTGYTFHRLLTRYRLFKAAPLIVSTNLSLLEVAAECGFGSLSSLERNFSKVLEQTPSRYRTHCRANGSVREFAARLPRSSRLLGTFS